MSTTKLNKTLNNRKKIPEIPRNRQAIAYPFGVSNEGNFTEALNIEEFESRLYDSPEQTNNQQ